MIKFVYYRVQRLKMDKKIFRQKCLERLKNAMHKNPVRSDRSVLAKLDRLLTRIKPRTILLYLPMEIEVDIRPLVQKWRKKCKIFVPFIEGTSFRMVEYRLPLTRNRYSIYEPPKSIRRDKHIDLMIVPVVGVDGNLRRIGFGKGMYDRFYATLKKKPVVVFVQRRACMTKMPLCDSYDIEADYYITPEMTLYRGKTDDNRDIVGRRWRIRR